MDNKQDLRLLYRLMFNLLPVQVLLCAIGAVNGIVSSFFATNFVGIDAMSAVGLYAPVSLVLTSASTVLMVGTAIICGKYMGQNQQEKLRGCFTLNISLSSVISFVFLVLFVVCAAFDLTGFFTRDEAIRKLFNNYLLGQAIGIFPYIIGSQLSVFLSMENRQKRTFFASLVYIIANLILNYVFVMVLNLEAFGLALASSLGLWAFCGVQGFYYITSKSCFRFDRKNLAWRECAEIIRNGFPGALSSWYMTIRGQIVNQLILAYVGSVGISAFATANNLLGIFWAIPAGMVNVSRMLMSISIGEEDRQTLENIMQAAFKRFIPLMCAVSAVLIACAVPFTRIFYQDPSEPVYMMTVWCLRILPLCMPFAIVCTHFVCYGQVSGQPVLVHLLSVLDGVVCVAVFSAVLSPVMGLNGVCAANVINGAAAVLAIIGYAWVKRKQYPRGIKEMMVIPKSFGVTEKERMDLQVRTMDEVVTVSQRVIDFCTKQGIDSRRAYFSGLFLEEMAGNVVEHGFEKDKKNHTVEIRVVHKEEDVILRIKDDCPAFDPSLRMSGIASEDKIKDVGIRIVFRLAKDVQYQHTLGLNVLTIRI